MRRRHGCCTSPKEVRSFCLRVLRTPKAGKRLNTSSPRFGVTATRSKIAWDGKATAVGSEGAREYSGIEICWRQRKSKSCDVHSGGGTKEDFHERHNR